MTSSCSLVKAASPGCVVEFMLGNKPQLAWVLEEHSGKLKLLTIAKRETNLAASRLLPWPGPQHAPGLSRQQIMDLLAGHQRRREELEAAVDPMEIWQLAQGEVEQAPVAWFAELLWEHPDADSVAALGRTLLECKTHFKFQPPEFEVFDADKAAARQTELETALRRETLVSAGQEFFRELWQARAGRGRPPAPPADAALAGQLESLLRRCIADPEDAEAAPLWRQMSKGLPEDPYLPLLLAKAWGLVDEHYNFLLDRAEYEAGDAWSAAFADEVERLRQAAGRPDKEPDPTPYVSVDSETTRDVDDALLFERTGDGGYLVRLALARPTLAWDFDSPLDKAVAARATSLYLPEGSSHMMPEALSTDAYSLLQGTPRPALVLDMTLDSRGAMLSCSPRTDWIVTAANLTYQQAEDCLADPAAPPHGLEDHAASLALGLELAHKLRQGRLDCGAVIIERPDPWLQLNGEGAHTRVELVCKPPCPSAQLLVSELMILANAAAAQWAAERGVPLLHRTQDIAIPPEYAGVWSEPHEAFRVVKALGAPVLEPDPKPHASLGVSAYCPVTSPLRRRIDLVNQAQMVHFLTHGVPRWSREELSAMLLLLSSRLDVVGQVQRFRPRYWKLLYFKQQGESVFHEAVVVEETDYAVTVALPREQIFVRERRSVFGDKVYLGQRFRVRVGKIDPLNNEIRALEAVEE